MRLDDHDCNLLFALARGEQVRGDRANLRRLLLINSSDKVTGRGLVALVMNGWVGPLPIASRPDAPIAGNRWASKREGE